MSRYELMYIINANTSEDEVPAIGERLQKIITDGAGTVDDVQVMGKKRLAYEIEKQREGLYFLVNFTAGPAVINELERVIGITESVIRHMIVNLEDKYKRQQA